MPFCNTNPKEHIIFFGFLPNSNIIFIIPDLLLKMWFCLIDIDFGVAKTDFFRLFLFLS